MDLVKVLNAIKALYPDLVIKRASIEPETAFVNQFDRPPTGYLKIELLVGVESEKAQGENESTPTLPKE